MSPLYTYQCPNCGAVKEEIRHIDDRKKVKRCHKSCHKDMELIIAPVAGIVKNPAVPKKVKK